MAEQILLIEDDVDLASSVIDYLQLEEISCDYSANGQSGLELALKNYYQVILLDINLPGMNGMAVCEALRAQSVDVPILMLTARDSTKDKLQGFKVGTDDYLVKPVIMDELVARIKALAKRRSLQATRLALKDLELDLSEKTARREGQLLALSPIEWTLLETLMRASPDVISRQALEQAVWQDDFPDSNALKVHLYRLRKKVDKPFSSPLIHTVPGHGVSMHADA